MKPVFLQRLGMSLLVSAGMCAMVSATAVAEDLGVIQVESSTIDDRFENKRDEASNIGVIKGEEVDAAHTENIQQMLQSIPGITTTFSSGDSLKIHIRGIENQVFMGEKPGVAVVIDGVPVFERTGAVNIDLDNIESIKVVKGGASYLFGDDALSGAVIITTKRGAHYKGFAAAAEAGDFNYKKGLLRAGFASDDANGHVQVSRRETDGYYDDSASKSDYLNGKLQYYIDDISDMTFGFELSDRWKNSHGSVKGVDAAKNDPRSADPIYDDYANHYDVNLAKYFATYARDMGGNDNLMVNVYRFSDTTHFLSRPTSNLDEYTYLNNYDQVQNGVKAEYRSGGENDAWLLATDLRANVYINDVEYNIAVPDNPWVPGDQSHSIGEKTSDDTTDETVQALYGEYKFRASDSLVMTVNGRYDYIAYDYTSDIDSLDLSTSFNVGSWRLGGNYTMAENSDIYANISTGFRAPSVKQLYAGDISPIGVGETGTESNPDLEPEHAINMEVGYRTKTTLFGAPTDLDVAIFQIDRTDYIMKTSGQYGSLGLVNDRYDNIGGVRNRGLELAMETTFNPAFSWHVAYTYLDAKFTKYDNYNLKLGGDGWNPVYNPSCAAVTDWVNEYCLENYDNTGNVVPRTSNHHLNTSVIYRLTPEWRVTGEMDAISSYYADEINRVKIDGHEVFNMLVNYDRAYGDSTWSFFLRVDNVFDKFYYNTARGGTGDSNADGVYDANDISIVVNQGRTYTAGLSVRF